MSDQSVEELDLPEVSETGGDRKKSLLKENMEVIKNVRVDLEVYLGGTELTVKDLFDLKPDEVLKLDKNINDPIDLLLDGNVVAHGQLVAVDDNFGIRILEIKSE